MQDGEIDYFKLIADEILHLRKGDRFANIVNRTFVNRYYYYIFHKYYEFFMNCLNSKQKKEIVNYKSSIHSLIRRTLNGLREQKLTSKCYSKLIGLRIDSDYRLQALIDDNTVIEVKKMVLYLEGQLNHISPSDLTTAFDKALGELSK
jgi:DNA-binding transcriptional regulator GbsR (MarR family)